jgi:hypothetical protein
LMPRVMPSEPFLSWMFVIGNVSWMIQVNDSSQNRVERRMKKDAFPLATSSWVFSRGHGRVEFYVKFGTFWIPRMAYNCVRSQKEKTHVVLSLPQRLLPRLLRLFTYTLIKQHAGSQNGSPSTGL